MFVELSSGLRWVKQGWDLLRAWEFNLKSLEKLARKNSGCGSPKNISNT